jgi:hypothetical protein
VLVQYYYGLIFIFEVVINSPDQLSVSMYLHKKLRMTATHRIEALVPRARQLFNFCRLGIWLIALILLMHPRQAGAQSYTIADLGVRTDLGFVSVVGINIQRSGGWYR